MIENGRDEDVCRQWDVLADEDHTHHLTPLEYYHYNCDWWLTSNKTGSNTVPVEYRPDFKQALSTLQKLKQRRRSFTKRPRTLADINNGHRVLLLLHGGVGKVHGGLLIPMKVTMEMNQVLIEQGDLLYKYLEQVFIQGMMFLNSFSLLKMDRLQLTAVCCIGGVNITEVQKCAQNGYREKMMN